MAKPKKRGKRNAGILLIGLGLAIFLSFMVVNALGFEIWNPFVPHINAAVTVTPQCFAACEIDKEHTTVDFTRNPGVSLTYLPCWGPFFGAEIFEKFEVEQSGYIGKKEGIRVCQEPVTQYFRFPMVPGKSCYDWKLTVGYKDGRGSEITHYVKQGRECFG